jgi:hypothetical protein
MVGIIKRVVFIVKARDSENGLRLAVSSEHNTANRKQNDQKGVGYGALHSASFFFSIASVLRPKPEQDWSPLK